MTANSRHVHLTLTQPLGKQDCSDHLAKILLKKVPNIAPAARSHVHEDVGGGSPACTPLACCASGGNQHTF